MWYIYSLIFTSHIPAPLTEEEIAAIEEAGAKGPSAVTGTIRKIGFPGVLIMGLILYLSFRFMYEYVV